MIHPRILVDQVKNSAPFLWSDPSPHALPYFSILQKADLTPDLYDAEHDPHAFFELCLASHFATVATFVPTDVDLLIRKKFWLKVHHPGALEGAWQKVQAFKSWDESPVSTRYLITRSLTQKQPQKISGHQGEWFSIALPAYATALKVAPDFVQTVREEIEEMVAHHEAILTELQKTFLEEPSPATLKPYTLAVAMIAHNLGDLDRMITEWDLPDTDVLKRRVFRAGHEDARSPRPILFHAGQLYQKFLAGEHHRHFPLREPKPLRRSAQFLIGSGPFFDDWGARLLTVGLNTNLINEGELREIVQALIEGWSRLNMKSIYTTVGYARALAGLQAAFPRGMDDLEALVSPALARMVKEGGLRTHLGITKKQYEGEWVRKIAGFLNSID